LCFTPLFALADAGDTRVVEMWQCDLKEGKEMDDVKANNTQWLAMSKKTGGSDAINSYSMTAVVGDLTKFMFVDSYPDMATWAKVKSAEDSPEGEAIEATFNELMECTENQLLESTQH
jgi:hypothetical protein